MTKSQIRQYNREVAFREITERVMAKIINVALSPMVWIKYALYFAVAFGGAFILSGAKYANGAIARFMVVYFCAQMVVQIAFGFVALFTICIYRGLGVLEDEQ